jgi:ATP-dependent 26S proteasome regulatory subunit
MSDTFTEQSSFSGDERAFRTVVDTVKLLSMYPLAFAALKTHPPKGILLHGPPGIGKTSAVLSASKACGTKLFTLNGHDLVGSHRGDAESTLRQKFQQAVRYSEDYSCPCIFFIDEIVALLTRIQLPQTGTCRQQNPLSLLSCLH